MGDEDDNIDESTSKNDIKDEEVTVNSDKWMVRPLKIKNI